MNAPIMSIKICCFVVIALLVSEPGYAQSEIPEPLQAWQDWATWEDAHRACPTPFSSADTHLCFWPSTLALTADQGSGSWELGVEVFDDSWVPLPGGPAMWPQDVGTDTGSVVVVERAGSPSVRLAKGSHRLTGEFRGKEMPQRIRIPKQVGLLSLRLEESKVDIPNLDEAGHLWLKRLRAEATDEDQLTVQVYRVIEDGIPMWLRTEIELSVSGKSREEDLGWALPAGWIPSSVQSPVPVAVDDEGRIRVQVRAGKWTIQLHAFRTTDAGEIAFAPGAEPVTDRELVGFRARPQFRMAEIEGLQPVDVTQTTFPKAWRKFPVYQWSTDRDFTLVEKMRGMGRQQPGGLIIQRQFWLDEDGKGLTFRDDVQGQMQQIWRLDVAEGQELGAVRIGGKGQLITANPNTGAHGVELRARDLNVQAIGRLPRIEEIPATGWRMDADSLSMTLNLPPGWRLLALFGADWVRGDWLTTWSLLDLFLLLIFSFAVVKLWGWPAGVVAFIAFGLAYHEPGAPRFTWLFLLIPLALQRVVLQGAGRAWVVALKFLAVGLLVLFLVPFVAQQIQGAIYPQLEVTGRSSSLRGLFGYSSIGSSLAGQSPPSVTREAAMGVKAGMDSYDDQPARGRGVSAGVQTSMKARARFRSQNLWYESNARIQTGPAEPEWKWNTIQCGWNGPVSGEQKIRPVLISLPVNRVLIGIRTVLLVVLAGLLLGMRLLRIPRLKHAASVALILLVAGSLEPASAEVPNAQTLETLRRRLLEPSDAYPNAAAIPDVHLELSDNQITMEAEIHCAIETAVPLPGRLPSWSPVTVRVNGESGLPLRRDNGYLWVVLPEGVHDVTVEGFLPGSTEWEWTFALAPKRVTIDAPGWQVTGVRPNGVPENQVFFTRQREVTDEQAAYDRRDFNVIVSVDRHLEVGLVWQVHSAARRLSSSAKAVSLRVPLIAGEKVLTPGVVVEDGFVEVKLGAGESAFAWESELPPGSAIHLRAQETDRWVEHWHLVTSPVWNAALDGLSPVFEPNESNLIPVWHPWPGEEVKLSFSRPDAVSGETITVRRVRHEVSLGSRQRTATLHIEVECSLADEFVLDLIPDAEIVSLKLDGRIIPVRQDGGKLIVPVSPGRQTMDVEWRTRQALSARVDADRVVLPVKAANITSVLRYPSNRWVLWADGPLRGPAVRFWTVLAVSVLAAWVLGSLKLSPIRRWDWMLLAIGLTQVYVFPALVVIGWFFLLAWRGKVEGVETWPRRFNLLQLGLVLLSGMSLMVLMAAVGEGLLGNPEMFIRGNGSSRTYLQWFQPRAGLDLPVPSVISVSVWFYRLLMLAWALWLAAAMIRWVKWGWTQFSRNGCWKKIRQKTDETRPPPLGPPKAQEAT